MTNTAELQALIAMAPVLAADVIRVTTERDAYRATKSGV